MEKLCDLNQELEQCKAKQVSNRFNVHREMNMANNSTDSHILIVIFRSMCIRDADDEIERTKTGSCRMRKWILFVNIFVWSQFRSKTISNDVRVHMINKSQQESGRVYVHVTETQRVKGIRMCYFNAVAHSDRLS